MKLMKPRNFLTFALAALSGAVLLHTSQSVQHAENRLEILRSSIAHEQEQVRVLRAEWESLNRPERLERLAKEYLDMHAPQIQTLVEDAESVPPPPPPEIMMEEGLMPPVLQPASAVDEGSP